MSYHHFTTDEKIRIEVFRNLGYSNRRIAKELGRHRSSIDREIGRNSVNGNYRAEVATTLYKERRAGSKPKGKRTVTMSERIEEKLMTTQSPEQITNTTTLGKVNFKTIYNWIYQGKLKVPLAVLRRKGNRL